MGDERQRRAMDIACKLDDYLCSTGDTEKVRRILITDELEAYSASLRAEVARLHEESLIRANEREDRVRELDATRREVARLRNLAKKELDDQALSRDLDEAREQVARYKPEGHKDLQEWREQWDMLCESSVKETYKVIELEKQVARLQQELNTSKSKLEEIALFDGRNWLELNKSLESATETIARLEKERDELRDRCIELGDTPAQIENLLLSVEAAGDGHKNLLEQLHIALNRVDELEKERDRWIPVSESFPICGKWALVVIDGYVQTRAACLLSMGVWNWADPEADSAPKEVVTHWRYLPDPPAAEARIRELEGGKSVALVPEDDFKTAPRE